jgi:2EXR family
MDLTTSERNITHSDNLTFTRFAELPKEIRLLIWDASVPGPRIVNIRQRYLTKTWDDIINEEGTKRRGAPTKAAGTKGDALEAPRLKGLKSDCPQPSILFACRESYTVASKYYQRAFHPADTIPEA